jgi:membrane protease YdiL (CAAX protease family)
MKRLFLALLAVSLVSFALLLVFFRASYLYDGALHLGMLSVALYFLWKKDLAATLKGIGFPGGIKNTLIYTVGGLLSIFALVFMLSIIAIQFGFNDQANVAQKIIELPLYILVLAVIFAPLTEELLFRALLVPRIGIVPSALVFGVMHFAYGSVVEIIGVVIVGVILALVYRYSKSITPCILIHLLYNLMSIVTMKMMS